MPDCTSRLSLGLSENKSQLFEQSSRCSETTARARDALAQRELIFDHFIQVVSISADLIIATLFRPWRWMLCQSTLVACPGNETPHAGPSPFPKSSTVKTFF